jgi:Sporulation and spore germination
VKSRPLRIAILVILLAALAGVVWFPELRTQVRRAERLDQKEEAAAREVIRAAQNDGQGKERIAIFWLSAENPRELAGVETPLALGTEPGQRARVALETLITGAPTPEQSPLPLGTTLQAFYMLPDGTAVADFSDVLSHEVLSGISTEQLAVDAIVRTVHAAVPQARRLKILVAGQELETLAGHVDMTGTFDLGAMASAGPGPAAEGSGGSGAAAAPAAGTAPLPAKAPQEKKPAGRPGGL